MTNTIRAWLRTSLQGTIVLGLAMIALVWTSVWFHLNVQREAAVRAAFQDTANLARTFEEHISRIIRAEDEKLLVLRTMYQRDPASFQAIDWAHRLKTDSTIALQYSIIDRNGQLATSSLGAVEPVDLADREHFRVHIEAGDDTLFIGRPVEEHAFSRPAIQLSRRLTGADGVFDGVIVASLDPGQLIKFYETIDVGRYGAISLLGTDGLSSRRPRLAV